jgi:sarcosine oxidase subunit beta
MGASIAYNLGLRGAPEVVLCDRGEIAGGATGRAMGGVRQQFSTPEEVRLARESIRFFEELGPPLFEQVGYLFVATTPDAWDELRTRRGLQASLGVPVEEVDPGFVPGLHTDDLVGAVFCAEDGIASPPAITRELVRRAADLGIEVRERTPAEDVEADVRVIAAGPWSAELGRKYGVDLPIRPLTRQLIATAPFDAPPDLPMVIEAETGFHFRRRDGQLFVAMPDAEPRWGFLEVDETVVADRLARLAHRYPPAAGLRAADAWTGAYDMTPDAHPIIGKVAEGVYAACGFSGHGFMQSPAVGAALAEEVLEGASSFDLSPYRLERFAGGASFPETVVL